MDLLIVKEISNPRETARLIDGSVFPRPFPLDIIVYRPWQLKEAQKKIFSSGAFCKTACYFMASGNSETNYLE